MKSDDKIHDDLLERCLRDFEKTRLSHVWGQIYQKNGLMFFIKLGLYFF